MTTELFNKHYTNKSQFDVIDIVYMTGLDFNAGNMLKYLARAGLKGSPVTDIIKARNYMRRMFPLLDDKEHGDHKLQSNFLFRSISQEKLCEANEKYISEWASARFDRLEKEAPQTASWNRVIRDIIAVMLRIKRVKYLTTVADIYSALNNLIEEMSSACDLDLSNYMDTKFESELSEDGREIRFRLNYDAWFDILMLQRECEGGTVMYPGELSFRIGDTVLTSDLVTVQRLESDEDHIDVTFIKLNDMTNDRNRYDRG